ncbi:MAG: hypothetical protein WCG92_03290 [Hyphomicrobiales bacterium]
MLLQQIGESLIGQFLKGRHPIAGEQIERHPGFVVDVDPLARHRLALTDSALEINSRFASRYFGLPL